MRLNKETPISFLNNAQRLSRIENFYIRLKIEPVGGQNTVTFKTSEPIVVSVRDMQGINAMIRREIDKSGEGALFDLNRLLTEHCKTMLAYCKIYFEGECDQDLHVQDNEVIRLDETGLSVHNLLGE